MTLQEQIQKALTMADIRSTNGVLLAGLSGGADSVCLLLALHEAGFPVEALHCNFELRGVESDADEAFCRRLCRQKEIPLHVRHFQTRNYARRRGMSIEMAARELRYHWFREEAVSHSAQAVAVAHHRDDQVETMLLNLIRGTGIHGLSGMHVSSPLPVVLGETVPLANPCRLVRPLLMVSRTEIEEWLRERGQTWQTDRTNLDPQAAMRNHVRLEVLPLLARLNPRIVETLAETCERMGEAEALYADGVKNAVRDVVVWKNQEITVSLHALLATLSPRSVLHEILIPLGFTAAQVGEVFAHLEGQSGKLWLSPMWRLLRDRDRLVLQPVGNSARPSVQVLPLEGFTELADGTRMLIRRQAVTPSFVIPHDSRIACFDLEKLVLPLEVRPVVEGDVIQPFGMNGTKLVSDLLTDRKLTLFEKERARVVVSGDRIAWVVGHRVAAGYEVDASTRFAMIVTLL